LSTWLISEITIVSEEACDLRLNVDRYGLIDPLDSTKNFSAGNGEFAVNIALIEDQRPVSGVVYAPAIDALFGLRKVRPNFRTAT
jgi:3'(2'), 5'-bisphosphate nucleotidase